MPITTFTVLLPTMLFFILKATMQLEPSSYMLIYIYTCPLLCCYFGVSMYESKLRLPTQSQVAYARVLCLS